MISNRSRLWWQEFSIAGVVVALGSCSSGPTQPEPAEVDEPGAISGALAVYIADYEDGTSETSYFLRDASGTERRLHFDAEPDITPGENVKVWGADGFDALQVTKIKLAAKVDPQGELGSQSSALIGAAPRTPRVLCPIMMSINGGTPPSATAVDAAWLSGAKSDNNYMNENSYARDQFTGKVYGPFPATITGCDTAGVKNAARAMVPATEGCQHYAYVMSSVTACAWAGLGAVGTSDKPQSDTWYNNTTSCVAAVQEVMHNWGSLHSSSIASCTGATPASGGINDTLAGCVHSEYGDKFDTLGGGCRHMNAWQKLYQKVWGGCNAVRVTATGDFNLYPTEVPCNGVQAIQIPFPGGKTRAWQGSTLTSWYLEYRTSTGNFDTGMAPQVLVHLGIAPVVANQANPRGSRVWIVNLGTTAAPGLVAGGSFSDPAGGLTVTVMSIDATKAVIHVDYPGGTGATPLCLDGLNTPFAPPGPSDCSTVPVPPDAGVIVAGTGGAGGRGGAAGAGGQGGSGGATDGGQAGGAQAGAGQAGGQAGGPSGGQAGGGQAGGAQADGGPGSGVTGAGGAAGARSTGTGPGADDLTGGCACRIEAAPRSHSPGALLALALGGLFASRRRRKKL